jgi:MFS transporter, ACS family, glucarate transporter
MAPHVPPQELTQRPTHVRYWVIVFAVALAVVTYIDRVCLSAATPSIRRDLGLSAKQMGWAFSAFGCAYALCEIPGGLMGDLMGPRKVLMRIVIWWSVCTAAIGRAWGFVPLVVTQFLFGAGEAGCFPNLTKAFTTWLPEREHVRAQGIMWLSARWGGAFTPLLVALVMNLVGWRNTFAIFGCLGVVWAVAFYFWYRDNPRQNPRVNQAERDLITRTAPPAAGHGNVPWRRFLRSQQVWMLCWQYFCLSYGWYFYLTWLPTYLREGRHLEFTHAALLNVLPLFVGGMGNPAAVLITGPITRWTGSVAAARRLIAYMGFAGAAGFLLLSTRVGDPTFAMIAMGIASFSNDLVMPGAWASAMDLGGKYCGTVSGAMNMWGNIGGALGPLVNGYILGGGLDLKLFALKWTLHWGAGNWNLTFYIAAGVYLMGIVCWSLLDPVTPLDL